VPHGRHALLEAVLHAAQRVVSPTDAIDGHARARQPRRTCRTRELGIDTDPSRRHRDEEAALRQSAHDGQERWVQVGLATDERDLEHTQIAQLIGHLEALRFRKLVRAGLLGAGAAMPAARRTLQRQLPDGKARAVARIDGTVGQKRGRASAPCSGEKRQVTLGLGCASVHARTVATSVPELGCNAVALPQPDSLGQATSEGADLGGPGVSS